MKKQIIFSKKSAAFLTAMTFLVSNVSWSAPNPGGSIEIPGTSKISAETSVFSLAGTLDIPQNIGVVKNRYVAENPTGTEPRNLLSPVIVHIQDAHTSYEAQENIRKILHHLSKEYRFDTVFLEGGIGEIDADRMRFFQKESANQRLAESLTQDGLIGGAEWFLLDATAQKEAPKISAMGVEDADLYRNNLAAYRHVATQRENAEEFLERLKPNMLTLSSHVFEKELRAFFKEWLFYQDSPNEIMRHLNTLKKYAGQHLKIDFANPRTQTEWPELYRIFRLGEIEKNLRPEEAKKEVARLKNWIAARGLDKKYEECFERILQGKSASNANIREPRRFVEEFYDRASVHGFSFRDYPHLSVALGIWILRNEIGAEALFAEAEQLSAGVLKKLSDGPSSKALLAAYQNYLLLRKLWTLQLTPEDYETLQQNKEALRPSHLTARIADIAASIKTGGSRELKTEKGLKAADRLYEMALHFYAGARIREEKIYRNMVEKMRARGSANAVLVTGGFHSRGLAEIFKKNQISYVHVTPHIADITRETKYADVMSLKTDRVTRRSTVNSPRMIMDAQMMAASNPAERDYYIGALGMDIAATIATTPPEQWPATVHDFNGSGAAQQWGFSISTDDGTLHAGSPSLKDTWGRTLLITPQGPKPVLQSRLEMRSQKSVGRKLAFEPLESRELLSSYPLPGSFDNQTLQGGVAEVASLRASVAQSGTTTLSNPDYAYTSRQVSTGIWKYDILKNTAVVATIPGPQSVSGSQSIHSNLAVPGQGPDVSPNGQYLMTAVKGTTGGYNVPSTSFQTILVYDLSGTLQQKVSLPDSQQLTDVRFTSADLIQVTDNTGKISLYDPKTGAPVTLGTTTLSNPDYAYTSRQVSTGIWKYDILKNTAVVATIPGPQSVSGSQSIHSNLAVPGQGPDVSPNGQYLMTAVKGTTGGYNVPSTSFQTILVYDLSGTLQQKVSLPDSQQLTDVRFTSADLIQVTDNTGKISLYDPKTGGQLTLPAGWSPTASNPNFASIIERSYVANGIYNLTAKVRNLVTGEELTVSSGQSSPYPGPRGAFDVSPDGTTVVFAYEGMYTPYGAVNFIILKHLTNLSEQLQLSGEFGMVRFTEGNAILETTGEDVNRRYQVDLNTLVNTETTYILANPTATTITYHQDAQLVAQIKRVQTTDKIKVYDSTNGTDRMSLLKDRAATTGYPSDTVTFVDIYRTPGGRGVVSYAAETYAPSPDYDYTTVLFDPRTGDELKLNGRATSVTYQGGVAQFNVTHRNGTTSVVKVDLETLQTLPAVTAYRVTAERVDGKTMYVFRNQDGKEVCRRSFGEMVVRVDAYSDGMIVVNYMKNAPEGTGVKVYAMIDEPKVGPHFEIPDMVAAADIRRGSLGELIIRGTTTDQRNNLTVTIINGQMTRDLEPFAVIQPAADQNLPLTPLSQSILADTQNVDVYSAGEPGTAKFYWLAHSTIIGQGNTDEGFGFVLGNNRDQGLIPQNLAGVTHLVMRTGSTNGTARIEIVAQKTENGIVKEIKDSVTVITTANLQTYEIPMTAFGHIDLSKDGVKLVYVINADEAPATMLAQVGPEESRIVSWNIAGQRVFYTNASKENWTLDQETGERNIGVLSPGYHKFTFFYRDRRDNQSIRIEDTQTGGQPLAVFGTGNNSTNDFLSLSPEGRYALIGKAYAGVYLVDLKTDTMKIVGVPVGPRGITQAAFPTSTAAALTAQNGQKWVLNLTSGAVTRILPGKTVTHRIFENGRLVEAQVLAWKGNKILLSQDVTYRYNDQGKRVSREIQYFNVNGTLRLDQWFNQANKLVYSLAATQTGVLKTMGLYHPATQDRFRIIFDAAGKPKTAVYYHGQTKKTERIPTPASLAAVPGKSNLWTLTVNGKSYTLNKATGQITATPETPSQLNLSKHAKAVDAALTELYHPTARAELRLAFSESYLEDYFGHNGLASLDAASTVFGLAGRSVSKALSPAMAAAFLDYYLGREESIAASRSESEDRNPLAEIAREALGEYAWLLDEQTGAAPVNPIFPLLGEDAALEQCIPFLPFVRAGDRFDLVMAARDERVKAFQTQLRDFARKLGFSEKLAAQIQVHPAASETEAGYAKAIEKVMARHPFFGNRGIPSRRAGLLEKIGEKGIRRMLMPERLKQQVVSLMTPVRLRNDDMTALKKIEIFEEWMREHNVHIDSLAANVSRMVQVIERLAASA
jgi:hypothetical protein